jgi:hypothetical protein
MKKQELEHSMALAALIISIGAAAFTGLQWYEARRTRIEVHDDAEAARKQVDHQFQIAREDAQEASKTQEAQVRESASAAGRSAKAAERTAAITEHSVALSRELFQISERTHVSVKGFSAQLSADSDGRVIAEIQNAGKTTAKRVTTILNLGVSQQPLSEQLLMTDLLPITPRPLDLVASNVITVEVPLGPVATQSTIKAIQEGTTTLYVWGHIEYADTFGKQHKTIFCATYDPHSKEKFSFCAYHNAVD